MKALEMLYRDKKWIEEECDISKISIERVKTTIKDLVEINEAIAELEALQHRSCEGCKHYTEVFSYVYPLCTRDEQYPFQIHNKEVLLCNKYESKEQLNEFYKRRS